MGQFVQEEGEKAFLITFLLCFYGGGVGQLKTTKTKQKNPISDYLFSSMCDTAWVFRFPTSQHGKNMLCMGKFSKAGLINFQQVKHWDDGEEKIEQVCVRN